MTLMKTNRAAKTTAAHSAAKTWDLVWSSLCAARRSGDAAAMQNAETEVRLYNKRFGFPERSGL